MRLRFNNLDVSENILIDKYQELSRSIPEYKKMYQVITPENIDMCFRHTIFDIALKSSDYDFYITNKENYNHFYKKFYGLYHKGIFPFLVGDNFDYISEIEIEEAIELLNNEDPFDCDFYNDNLEDR